MKSNHVDRIAAAIVFAVLIAAWCCQSIGNYRIGNSSDDLTSIVFGLAMVFSFLRAIWG